MTGLNPLVGNRYCKIIIEYKYKETPLSVSWKCRNILHAILTGYEVTVQTSLPKID